MRLLPHPAGTSERKPEHALAPVPTNSGRSVASRVHACATVHVQSTRCKRARAGATVHEQWPSVASWTRASAAVHEASRAERALAPLSTSRGRRVASRARAASMDNTHGHAHGHVHVTAHEQCGHPHAGNMHAASLLAREHRDARRTKHTAHEQCTSHRVPCACRVPCPTSKAQHVAAQVQSRTREGMHTKYACLKRQACRQQSINQPIPTTDHKSQTTFNHTQQSIIHGCHQAASHTRIERHITVYIYSTHRDIRVLPRDA